MRKLVIAFLLMTSLGAWAQSPSQLLDQTWSLVEANFYDSQMRGLDWAGLKGEAARELGGVDDTESAVGVINGYLSMLKTSHTRLYCDQDPQYYELLDVFAYGPQGVEIRSRFDGALPSYVGIGATFEGQTVVDVVPGGPADQAGLQPRDEVLGVSDSEDGEYRPLHPLRSFLGKDGREMFIKVQSGLVIAPRRITPIVIQPRAAFLQSIDDSAEIIERDGHRLAYVRVYSYAGEVFQGRLIQVLEGPLAEAEGLVLDIRGGWGGAHTKCLEYFQPLPELTLIPRDGEEVVLKPERWNRPVVLLIDGRTRSGKEVFAHGFQSQNLGPVLGSTTAGAVSGGRLFLLPGGCALYLAVTDIRVDGQRLEGAGVTPDEAMVEPTLPTADPSVKDRALDRLLKLLQ